MKRMVIVFALIVFAFTFAGCAGMSRTQQTTLSGAGIGAAGGAVLGAVVGGSPLAGAAVGAAVGGAAGYIVGEQNDGRRRRR
jgi:osmotically inducible lipoprotein OsmB